MTTPLLLIENPPGLAAIDCRIGTHARLRRQLLDGLATRPALARLTTRSDQDLTIALLDAWACAADVLTFYQDRLAAESFIDTADERLSIRHLARLVGCELDPGVAAETTLVFTADPLITRGAPLLVEAGLQAQSAPKPGQAAQIFATSEALELRSAWNELRPAPTAPGVAPAHSLTLAAALADLRAADAAPGALVLVAGDDPEDVQVLLPGTYTVEDLDGPLVRITWTDLAAPPKAPHVFVLRRRVPLVIEGSNELKIPRGGYVGPPPLWIVVAEDGRAERLDGFDPADGPSVIGLHYGPQPENRRPLAAFTPASEVLFDALELTVHAADPPAQPRLWLRGAQPQLRPGDAVLCVADDDPTNWRFALVRAVEPDRERGLASATLEPLLPRWQPPLRGAYRVHALRQRAALFGHNAPDPQLIAVPPNSNAVDTQLINGVQTIVGWTGYAAPDPAIDLDAAHVSAAPGGPVVLVRGAVVDLETIAQVRTVSRVDFGLSARITRITPVPRPGPARERFARRDTEVFFAPELLPLADPPDERDVTGSVVTLAGAHDLPAARLLMLSGATLDGSPAAELARVSASLIQGERTRVTLAAPLQHSYRRASVVLRGNVVPASHGEALDEVLGSGDPTRPFQSFTLRAGPLTYLRTATPAGRSAALVLRVDGQPWREVASLASSGPQDRVYALRGEEDGSTRVQFGDGVHGARLPAGRDNVRASYRRGTGLAGHVDANTITTALARPPGVQSVDNPQPARGGADPEGLADARRRAPASVRALERVVSLRDYADYARTFPGVARAHAAGFGEGLQRGVVLTIAGPGGAKITPDDPTWTGLRAALRVSGDPFVRLWLRAFTPVPFTLAGTVRREPDAAPAALRLAVEAALRARFGFDARDFGQAVYRSEVLAAVQSVPGVLGLDLDLLRRSGDGDGDPEATSLGAALEPSPGGLAEILTLDFTNLLTPAEVATLKVTP